MKLPQINTKETISTLPSNPYLFKNITDAFFYLIVYLGLPLYSVIEGINHFDGAVFFTALSCCICVIYDCYSRYDKSCGYSKVRKLYIIGIPHGILVLYTFYSIQCYVNQKQPQFLWIYILLAIAPIIGGIDCMQMIRDDIKSRRD